MRLGPARIGMFSEMRRRESFSAVAGAVDSLNGRA
jgi:hypothetical protein